ncbi:hypothetical protein RUM44_009847 [Polyplax serrata]|uniref:Phosphatidylinositol N-acetylglucosaminyltransferase subunit C n=1 Tax=Polyplax serrata TaxID=468196 RepID=A0ABR1ATV8_POLSC
MRVKSNEETCRESNFYYEHASRKPWKKNLYENVGYPDNYTDDSFLKELKKNIHVRDITYYQALLEVIKVTEKLCVVILFSVVFSYLHNEWVKPQTVFVQTSFVVFLCFTYYAKTQSSLSYRTIVSRNFRSVGILLMLGYILSPVLRTLTDTISTDTIYATSTVMMLVHVGFFDYNHPVSIVSSSLSLNAAIFSSVCLASRLQTSFCAFVLLTISVEFFVLYPYFRNSVIPLNVPFSFLLTLGTLALLSKYKDNIYGPWDEAVISDFVDIKKYVFSTNK